MTFAAPSAKADDFPNKPIRMIVSFAAGGPTDIVGRLIGAAMSEVIGQQILIENRTGAGGNLGADVVAKSPPDGYTMLMATVSTHAINPGLYRHIPYDPIKDFIPIGQVGVTPTLFSVHPSLPVKNVKDMIELVKANPGKYTYGSSGVGSILHLCGEEFKTAAGGLNLVHVPYRGSAPMTNDLIGGQISMVFDAIPTALPVALAGKTRALAAGMAKRLRQLPDLPTMQEQGVKGFECYTWNALMAPGGTPMPIVNKLNAALNAAMAKPAVIALLQKVGSEPTPGSTPQSTMNFVKEELVKWAPIIKASGAHVD
jgi:tripartite-type tricarboxylate transporter receptor subunit TctC